MELWMCLLLGLTLLAMVGVVAVVVAGGPRLDELRRAGSTKGRT